MSVNRETKNENSFFQNDGISVGGYTFQYLTSHIYGIKS